MARPKNVRRRWFTPRVRQQLLQIVPFGIIWLVNGLIFLTVEYAATRDLVPVSDKVIDLSPRVFVFAMVAVTLVGCLIGLIELFLVNRLFARYNFWQKLLGKFLVYALFLMLIISVMYPIAASIESGRSLADPAIWQRYLRFLGSINFLSTAFQMAVSLVSCLLYAEVSQNAGHALLINFVSGRYHQPREESRIFMFLDMKSSTSIAEDLGHITYFRLLKAYYRVLSDPLVDYHGEIYQYVGDEMVVSWRLNRGLSRATCLRCFFAMRRALRERGGWFEQQFGVAPTFKAGLHLGKVTAGEIGSQKKSIVFTGDVLNATARIQGLCNGFGVDNLLSGQLVDALGTQEKMTFTPLGSRELRGKSAPMELFTAELPD